MKHIFMALMILFSALNSAWAGASMPVNNLASDQQTSDHSIHQKPLLELTSHAQMTMMDDHCPSMAVQPAVETVADNSCPHSVGDCICDLACPASVSSVVFQSFSFAALATQQSYVLLMAEQFPQVTLQGLDRPPRLS